MNQPTYADFPAVIEEVIKELGLTQEEAIAALEYISAPTIRPMVGIREFIESPYYMGAVKSDGTQTIYPKVMDELEALNSGQYDEAVLTGGIGSGKTTVALYSTAYQLYRLSCYEDPHHLYGLDPSSEIVFIFQSITAKAAKAVDYQRFRAMIEKSQYFREHFIFDKTLESELIFPKRIIVRPVSSKDTAAVGQNVFGGIIDEINQMALIEDSRMSIDRGFYDQAKALYDSISKRRRSRFGMAGSLPGLLCMVSSARYPGQFTDGKIDEAHKQISDTGKSTIYIYDKCEWDVKPPSRYTGKWFDIFIGDEGRKPRILHVGEAATFKPEDHYLIRAIPEEYRADFERDMMGSLRDTAGVATIARHPFIPDREQVMLCIRKTDIIFARDVVDFVETKLDIALPFHNPKIPRFVHCDLALTGDSAGVAIGHVEKFITVERGNNQLEVLPLIYIDALLEIKPPRGGEIQLFKVREIIYALKKMGMNIHWCSFDQFQSRDSMQLLKQQGYQVGYQSMDANTMPYDFLKNAIYDNRVSIPRHEKVLKELLSLEKDVKRNKIDHPANGSKDVADALAGVVFGLTMRREVWASHGVSLGAIPSSIAMAIAKKSKEKEVAKGVEVVPPDLKEVA